MSDETNETQKEPKWFYEDDTDKELGIETLVSDGGNKSKRCTLTDGRIAVVQRLKARDLKMIRRQMGGEADKFQEAVIAASVTINNEKVIIEEMDDIWMDDYTKILAMASINFPTATDQ